MPDKLTYFAAATADIHETALVGPGSTIWHLAQIREDVRIGDQCIVGRGAYIGSGVVVGNRCKIQNYALVYEPSVLGNGVFIGPSVIFTNDEFPRAVNNDGSQKQGKDWESVGVTVLEGASIGARAVCIAPVRIGSWAMVAAGSVVTRDVADFALVVGVPARQVGWVGRSGVPLERESADVFCCPVSGERYRENGGLLELIQGRRVSHQITNS